MAEDPWIEGRQAWRRLAEWNQLENDVHSARPLDADGALRALGDVGLVRRLLDQAEFEAVRSARRQGRSWSEIAVRLGVTRQSAWERWRDVDDNAADNAADAAAPAGGTRHDPVTGAAVELSAQARERRRRSSVIVPDVVGSSWPDARQLLSVNGLIGVDAESDGPPRITDPRPGEVVVDQSPEAGAKVSPGTTVKLWLSRRGGGAGVREPRRPVPDPVPGAKMRDEVTDQAV
ncbi:PASTA domain-containing protein [Actinophytocola sp.]|uniref:PASTA domain-containing protein n=1 Tax=Actinophytocola sp. TaxID=1872138 RepID=UPI00389A5D14